MIVHTPVVVSEDRAAVRAAAKRQFGFYQRLPYYSQMLQDAGFPEAGGEEFSERMADALIISGPAEAVAERIGAMPDDGVDEMLAAIVSLPDDREATQRTLALLGELARGA